MSPETKSRLDHVRSTIEEGDRYMANEMRRLDMRRQQEIERQEHFAFRKIMMVNSIANGHVIILTALFINLFFVLAHKNINGLAGVCFCMIAIASAWSQHVFFELRNTVALSATSILTIMATIIAWSCAIFLLARYING